MTLEIEICGSCGVVLIFKVHPLATEMCELWLEVIAIFAHADFFNCFLHRYFGEKEAEEPGAWRAWFGPVFTTGIK